MSHLMKLPDTNLLLYAINPGCVQHFQARTWLENALNEKLGIGFAWLALVGFVRTATQARIIKPPLSVDMALAAVDDWLRHPNACVLHPTERHGDIFARLLIGAGFAGNLTNDAHLAALAIEHNAEIGTFDSDFKRFPGLQLQLLVSLDSQK